MTTASAKLPHVVQEIGSKHKRNGRLVDLLVGWLVGRSILYSTERRAISKQEQEYKQQRQQSITNYKENNQTETKKKRKPSGFAENKVNGRLSNIKWQLYDDKLVKRKNLEKARKE